MNSIVLGLNLLVGFMNLIIIIHMSRVLIARRRNARKDTV